MKEKITFLDVKIADFHIQKSGHFEIRVIIDYLLF
jgi:hypothetical protein